MSLQLANQVDTRCSMTRQYTYEIDWIPGNHYDAGTSIELRSCCRRAFHSWRYVRMEMENGDMVFHCNVAPSSSEMWANSDFVIMRTVLQYRAVKGERYRIRPVPFPVSIGMNGPRILGSGLP